LSLHLYLDDCAFSKRLRDNLQAHGYDVVIPLDCGLLGAADEAHFEYAKLHRLILITMNPRAFESLHKRDASHSGILAVYQDNDARDMTYDDISRAITSLERSGTTIEGQFHVLNARRF
jgi:hypothetical protein